MSLFDLHGKVALVTGATKGIGLGIAQHLVAHGARVIVSSRDQAACEALANELNAGRGGEMVARGIACDIDNLGDIDRLAAGAAEAFGRLDVLVANASRPVVPTALTSAEEFDKMLSTNIHHNYRLCQAVRPAIAAARGGSIILIGSIAGHEAAPAILPYAVSKAGLAHLARCLADEMVSQNIRVNCISPGLIRSFSTETQVLSNQAFADALIAQIPLKRIGEPEDVAGAVVFLASRAGSYVTGATILVDGGRNSLSAPQPAY